MVYEDHHPRQQQVFAALPKIHQQPESSGTTEFVAVPQHAHTISESYPATANLPSGQQQILAHHRHDKHSHPHHEHEHQHHHQHWPNLNSPHRHHQSHHHEHGHNKNISHSNDSASHHHQEQVSANALAAKLGDLENQHLFSRAQDTEKMGPGSQQPIRLPAKVLPAKVHHDPSSISSSSSQSSTSAMSSAAMSSASTQLSELQQRGEKVLNSILERLDQNSADLTTAPSDDSVSWINSTLPSAEATGENSVEKVRRRISPELLKDQQRNLQQHHGCANLRHS